MRHWTCHTCAQVLVGEAQSCQDAEICAALQQHLRLDAAPAFAASEPAPTTNGTAQRAARSTPQGRKPMLAWGPGTSQVRLLHNAQVLWTTSQTFWNNKGCELSVEPGGQPLMRILRGQHAAAAGAGAQR